MEYNIEKILEMYEDDYNPSSTVPGPRNMYAGGQLVSPSVDGSRPGYDGRKDRGRDIHQEKKFKKAEKIKTLTKKILKQNSKIKNGYNVLKINPGSFSTKTTNNIYTKVLKAAGGKDKVNIKNLSKTVNEIINSENYLSPDKYRRQIIVDLFMDDYANNGQFTGEAKLDPRLAEFKGPPRQTYTGINKTFKEWANGDFEVDGFDRSTFDKITNKNLKNWKPIDNVNDRRIQVKKELKFLNNLNDTKPNLSGDEVKKLFTKEFKNSPYWRDTSFVNRITQLYPHKIYGEGRNGTTVEGINKGNRSSWLQKSYAESKSGNFSRALIAADVAEANGDLQLAKKYRKAGKDLFMLKTGAISKIPGQAEHPWFHNYGKGLFQIDSIVKGDLNYFKRQNFEVPIRNLITEYESKTKPPTLARKKAIESEINLRRRFLNTITDIGDGGMARNVTFDYKSNPGTIKVINKTPDIYKQYLSNRLDPLELQTRGTSYRNALIKNLKEADYNIMKKGTEVIKTGKLGINNIKTLLTKLCPKGKASGGRIGFNTAGAVLGSGANCGRNHMNKLLKNGTGTTEERNLIRQVMKAGFDFAKGTGKAAVNLLNPKEFLKLKNWVGGPAMAFMAGVEGLDVADRVVRQGIPIKEALGEKWTKFLMPRSLQEYQVEGMKEANALSSPASKRYAKGIELSNDLVRAYDQLEMLEKGEAAKFRKTGDAERIADLKKLIRTKEKKYYDYLYQTDEKGNVLGDGELDFIKDYNEYRATTKTGRDFTDLDIFGGMNDMGTDEMSGLKIKRDYFPMYEIGTSKIPSEQELAFDATLAKEPFVRERLVPLPQLKDFKYQNKELPTQNRIDAENFFTEYGVLPPRTSLSEIPLSGKGNIYDLLKDLTDDYNRIQKSKEARMYPAYGGSQFSEGGITTLRSKYEYKK